MDSTISPTGKADPPSQADEEVRTIFNELPMVQLAAGYLDEIFIKHNVDRSHGLTHALRVASHAARATHSCTYLTNEQCLAIILAALLHDADDRKFFPDHDNFQNARAILGACVCPTSTSELVVKMIGYVSTAKNGDSIPQDAATHPWLLYPRYADRLEAIGWIGVVRCWEYTLTTQKPLYLSSTPRKTSIAAILMDATPERFQAYHGSSESMIDHYFDKLLHIGNFQSGNAYLDDEARYRQAPLYAICISYGVLGYLSENILKFAQAEVKKEAEGAHHQ